MSDENNITKIEEALEGKAPRVAGIFNGEVVARTLPGVRAHRDVVVQVDDTLDLGSLREAAKADAQGFHDTVRALARRRREAIRLRRSGSFRVDHEAEGLSFSKISSGTMKELRAAFDFDITVKTPTLSGETRSVTTSGFTLLTSAMAVEDVNMAYEAVPTVMELLIGAEIDDNQPNTEIGGVLDFGHAKPLEVPKPRAELNEYPDVLEAEERYTALCYHDGFKRRFSQQFVDRAPQQVFAQLMDLGRHMRELIEMRGLIKVTDHYGSKESNGYFHAMHRERAAAALFSATANTPGTRAPSGTRITNNALVDDTDLAALRQRLAGMLNAAGFPIANRPTVILVPDALWETAWKLLRSELNPGTWNEANFYGPMGPMGLMLISTPYLDLMSTTAWYGGDPRRVFVRKWALRPETAVHGGSATEAFVSTRQAMLVRVAWDCDVAARDYVGWCQCLTGTTAPADA